MTPRTVVVATHNRGKAAEFARMLAGDAAGDAAGDSAGDTATVKWLDLSAFPDAGEVEETGHTFRANACLKATEYARRTGHWALADDSGLEVDALGGLPGVYSARFAALYATEDCGSSIVDCGEEASDIPQSTINDPQPISPDAANNRLLLIKLDAVPDGSRSARFVCVLALADPSGKIVCTARDTVEGRIIRSPRGTNGFGYDPLFEVAGGDGLLCGRTMAEHAPAEKAAISHRGRALARLKGLLGPVWASGTEGQL